MWWYKWNKALWDLVAFFLKENIKNTAHTFVFYFFVLY